MAIRGVKKSAPNQGEKYGHFQRTGVAEKTIAHEEQENGRDMEDRWLSVGEIGKLLGVSSDTVYRWIDKHAMLVQRMGRLWKFKKDQVDAWVEAGGVADKTEKDGQ